MLRVSGESRSIAEFAAVVVALVILVDDRKEASAANRISAFEFPRSTVVVAPNNSAGVEFAPSSNGHPDNLGTACCWLLFSSRIFYGY